MSTTKPHQRVFASVMALLFLGTAVATTAGVIWQVQQQGKTDKALQEIQKNANNSQDLQNNDNQAEDPNMLKGKPLADFTPISDTISEIQIIDIKEGDGAVVAEGATITAHYTGAYVVNGVVFESSKDSGQPATFPLSGVIQGWQNGVPGMKVGGVRRLVIPGAQAYGEAPEGYNPGDGGRPMGPLVFDIELQSIGQ
jgi:FKBP-type peptidyl-prolyl cis-trans isomerase